jgi:DNA-binding transcriptional LysR family regulator
MLDLVDLKTFARVAASRSFAEAARSLGVTPSATSRAVARLEQHLGLKLFVRTTRSVRLTEAGEGFRQRIERALTELDDAESAAFDQRKTPHGLLRIELPLALGVRRVVPLLPAFCARFPDISLEVRSSDRFADLVADEVDVALRVGPLEDVRLIARKVDTSRVVTLAAPAYLRKHGRPRTPEELARHVCLIFRSSNSGRVLAWRFAAGDKQTQLIPERAHVFSSSEAMLAAASAGLGVAQVLDFSAEAALARRDLVAILRERQAPGPAISLVCRPERAQLPKVRAFSDFIADALRARRAR